MKHTFFRNPGRPGRRAFTLIEMVGVMALIAISAAMILPALIAQTDNATASLENAALQSYVTALQNSIQRHHVIPGVTGPNGWVNVVATELGVTSNSIAFNAHNNQRVLVIDTNGFGKMGALPYTEPSTGMPDALTNSTSPRLMIVSSLGAALPAMLTTLTTNTTVNLSPADFNALWNTANGTVPAANEVWSGWTGHATDVAVQRMDAGYLFAHLVLSNEDTNTVYFSVNGNLQSLAPAPATTNLNAYYLTATALNLYLSVVTNGLVNWTNLEAAQILNKDSSWVYSGGGWRNAAVAAPAIVDLGTTNVAAGVVISSETNVVIHDYCRQCRCHDFWPHWCCCWLDWDLDHHCHWHTNDQTKFCCDWTNFNLAYQNYVSNNCVHDGFFWPALCNWGQLVCHDCCCLCNAQNHCNG